MVGLINTAGFACSYWPVEQLFTEHAACTCPHDGKRVQSQLLPQLSFNEDIIAFNYLYTLGKADD